MPQKWHFRWLPPSQGTTARDFYEGVISTENWMSTYCPGWRVSSPLDGLASTSTRTLCVNTPPPPRAGVPLIGWPQGGLPASAGRALGCRAVCEEKAAGERGAGPSAGSGLRGERGRGSAGRRTPAPPRPKRPHGQSTPAAGMTSPVLPKEERADWRRGKGGGKGKAQASPMGGRAGRLGRADVRAPGRMGVYFALGRSSRRH